MRIFQLPSLLLFVSMMLCLASCTSENSENILTEMDEVTPQESYVTYEGAKSATSEGIGFVCTDDDMTTETVLTGEAGGISDFVIERTSTADGQSLGDLITLLIEDRSTSGDTTFLSTDYAFCINCLTSFENNGTTLEGSFTGEFHQLDENGGETPFGELTGSFNVLIEDAPFFCE